MNDDYVQPNRGFGTHGHKDMEIITYIVQGKLTHKDSMGTEETLGRGSVQFMTAGRGIRHSEYNHETESGLRFIQTWVTPRKNGLDPNYGSFDPISQHTTQTIDSGSSSSDTTTTTTTTTCTTRNQWRHMVSDCQNHKFPNTPVKIAQDTNLFVAEMDANQTINFDIKVGRMAYMLCVEGSMTLMSNSSDTPGDEEVTNTVVLQRHDGCEIKPDREGGTKLTITATGLENVEGVDISAHVLLFEMAYVTGSGRKDLN
jgi:redox-sensitive bicupin YhaK (pirin superfamily)